MSIMRFWHLLIVYGVAAMATAIFLGLLAGCTNRHPPMAARPDEPMFNQAYSPDADRAALEATLEAVRRANADQTTRDLLQASQYFARMAGPSRLPAGAYTLNPGPTTCMPFGPGIQCNQW